MLRVGLVGQEDSIRKHIRALNRMPLVTISGYLGQGIGLPDDSGIKSFRSSELEEFISQSDAFIFSGNGIELYNYAIQVIRRARNVFFDEFVVNQIDKLAAIQKMANEANCFIHVRNDKRTHPAWTTGTAQLIKAQYAEFIVTDLPGKAGITDELWLKRVAMDLDLLIDLVHAGVKRTSPTGISVMQHGIDLMNLKIEFINGFAANLNYRLLAESRIDRCIFYEKGSMVEIDFLNCTVLRKSQFEQKKFSINLNCLADTELSHFIEYIGSLDLAVAHSRYDYHLPLHIATQSIEKILRRHSVTIF
jgi:hypothetical protein